MTFSDVKKIVFIVLTLVLLVVFSYAENNLLTTTKLTVTSADMPESLDGYTIVHLSDLHSKWFGEGQTKLIERVKDEKPNAIMFTGDLVDRRKSDRQAGMVLMKKLVDVAPVYFVTGNHEWKVERRRALMNSLEAEGVHVLRNSNLTLTYQGSPFTLVGIDDPSSGKVVEASLEEALEGAATDYTILLSHRPEMFSVYQDDGIDLIFSGHAHGGQIRLPFIGGLAAPGQGLFPVYTSGKYTENGSTLVMSRGLGNSIFPQRIFNRPEVVSVTLSTG